MATEAASTIPPGRMIMFVSGRIQRDPGRGDRYSKPSGPALAGATTERQSDAAVTATPSARVIRAIGDPLKYLGDGTPPPPTASAPTRGS